MIRIDRDKCINCAGCAAVCPFMAIRMTSNGPIVDPEKCTDCGICVRACPTRAITLERNMSGHLQKGKGSADAQP